MVSFKLRIVVDVFILKTLMGFTFPITDNMIPGSMHVSSLEIGILNLKIAKGLI